jgi:hypothetical protein
LIFAKTTTHIQNILFLPFHIYYKFYSAVLSNFGLKFTAYQKLLCCAVAAMFALTYSKIEIKQKIYHSVCYKMNASKM